MLSTLSRAPYLVGWLLLGSLALCGQPKQTLPPQGCTTQPRVISSLTDGRFR